MAQSHCRRQKIAPEQYDQDCEHLRSRMLIDTLAESFVSSGYDLKSLLADMVMSPWYRQSDVSDPERVAGREVELSTVGRGRLLTPEELDRKTAQCLVGHGASGNDGTSPTHLGPRRSLQASGRLTKLSTGASMGRL